MNREQENYFQLRDNRDNKYHCRECYSHKDAASSGSRVGGGGALRSTCLASANLLLDGKQGVCGGPIEHSNTEDRWSSLFQAGFLVQVLSEDPSSKAVIRREGWKALAKGDSQLEQNCLL